MLLGSEGCLSIYTHIDVVVAVENPIATISSFLFYLINTILYIKDIVAINSNQQP